MTIVDPTFHEEMKRYGQDSVLMCFHCGTCAALCPLLGEHFPRQMIRYAQIGAKERIVANARDLWRCLHCGLCTQTCPRGANPGELILSLKRYVASSWRRD